MNAGCSCARHAAGRSLTDALLAAASRRKGKRSRARRQRRPDAACSCLLSLWFPNLGVLGTQAMPARLMPCGPLMLLLFPVSEPHLRSGTCRHVLCFTALGHCFSLAPCMLAIWSTSGTCNNLASVPARTHAFTRLQHCLLLPVFSTPQSVRQTECCSPSSAQVRVTH